MTFPLFIAVVSLGLGYGVLYKYRQAPYAFVLFAAWLGIWYGLRCLWIAM